MTKSTTASYVSGYRDCRGCREHSVNQALKICPGDHGDHGELRLSTPFSYVVLRSPRFVHGGRNLDCRGRREHSVNVALQSIPLRIYKFCLFQFSPRLFGFPNVHSTLRSTNREGFSRRPWLHYDEVKDLTLGTHQGELCNKNLYR